EDAGNKFNDKPRLGGNYLWRQAYNAKWAGANMLYLAMFDEVDEATALFKTTPTAETSPKVIYATGYTNRWVRLDIDGYNLPSDWYLQVCGEINRMFKGERPPTNNLPISPNARPVITSTPVTNGIVGALYSYTLTATDTETNALSYSGITLPAWLSFNTNTAVLSGTPAMGDIGSHAVALRVSDLQGSTNQSFTIWVGTAGNDAPLITSLPSTGVIENQAYSYTISAMDVDGDPLTYGAPVKPAWLSFNAGTRVLSGTPAPTNAGLNLVNLTVSDGTVTVTQQFNVAVFAGAFSSNLVQNGSFELGGASPTSWSVGSSTVGSTEQAQQGSASLKMMAGASNTRQTIPLQTNTAYQLSVWVLASGLTSGGVRFDTNDKFDQPNGPNGPGGTCQFNIETGDAQIWTQYTGTFNSSNETSVTIRTYQSSMAGSAYFDNAVLVATIGSNAAPVITSVPETRVNQDALYNYTLLAADAGSEPLIFTGVTIPSWLSFNTNSGLLSGVPASADAGSHLVTLRVSDGLLTDEQSFSVQVVQTGSGYAAWAATNGVGAPDVDHDGDGRNNLYEYALNGNPTNSTDNGIDPVLISTGSGFEYIHLQRNGDSGLIYTVETRTNLLSGIWMTNGTSVLGTNAYNAVYDEVRHGVAVTNTRSYIRLKIENR
ncbi:MAG: putative Ig domain-containing protein, partial [Pontiellaceae bacterium]|nr:putative Ig domain-containing protein [Pontiellaceae bacterium]